MPSPKALLDRTTKFVLNAAHGKSRSLIPTTDNNNRSGTFNETGIVDWEEDDDVYDDEEDEEELDSGLYEGGDDAMFGPDSRRYIRQARDGTLLVNENDVLMGFWNSSQIVSDMDDNRGHDDDQHSARSVTPPGMLRIRPVSLSQRGMVPQRKRTATRRRSSTASRQLHAVMSEANVVEDAHEPDLLAQTVDDIAIVTAPARRRASQRLFHRRMKKVTFISLPPRVIARILMFLPVPEMLSVSNSCRIVRRVMCRNEPGGNVHRTDDGNDQELQEDVGDRAYTILGIRVWRMMIQRLGWRVWHERERGKERRQRISIPKSHGRLLREICGVEDESELLDIMASEPDLLFKAVYDDLIRDYHSFRTLENSIAAIFRSGPNLNVPAHVSQKQRIVRTPAEVAERLDQLLWFGRGQFAFDADQINRRLVVLADKFESAYRDRFRQAFVDGDCERMREFAGVLEHIREGRGCIRILVDSHPLFNCYEHMDSRYALVLRTSDQVIDAHTFDVFLDGLQRTIHEHARVVSLALPLPTLPTSALYCFIQALFSNNGVALNTLKKLYAHLRSIPVGASPEPAARYGKPTQVVPDEATKDILYLTTVADIVAQLLVASDSWSAMDPVAVPSELGRRCVFSAFDDVIQDYVQLERRIIERAYEAELSQWLTKTKADPFGSGGSRHDNAHGS
ncbi:hypothetical protein EC988_004287, partial [Linderina pennispora]